MPRMESRIDTVTLYHQGATVRRVVDLPCTDGKPPAEIEIPGLPLSVFDPSVRLRVESWDNAGADLVATHVTVGLHVPDQSLPLDTPDAAELKRVKRSIHLKQEALRQLHDEVELLKQVPVPARPEPEEGKTPPPSPMTSRVAMERFLEEGLEARVTQMRALRREVEQLEEQADAVQRKLDLASTATKVKPHELTKSVVARVKHTGGPVKQARLTLDYFVHGARWAPAYQCRMSRDCRKADIGMRALVCQQSGEDWHNVKLQLSTAAPMTWTELPELSSIRIGKAQPPVSAKKGFRPAPQGVEVLFADHDRDRARVGALMPAPQTWTPPSVQLSPPPSIDSVLDISALQREEREEDERPQRRKKGAKSLDDEPGWGGGMAMASEMPMQAMAMACSEPCEPMPAAPPPPPAAPGFMPPPAPMPQPAAKMVMRSAAPRPGAPPPPPAQPTRTQLEMVVFTHLRLASAEERGTRNRLEPVDQRRTYLESLSRHPVTVDLDVMQVVGEAEQKGRAVHQVALPPGTVDVRQAAGHFDYTYQADNPVDVRSDGVFHSVALGTRSAEADVLYVVVPREDSQVYRQARIRNPLSAPLIAGPAEIYVGGEYVLGTTLPTVPADGEFHLGLGVEQAIKCARNTFFKEQRSGTKIVATSELWHDIVIDIVNNLEREIRCEVRERLPQPAENAEVVVEEGSVAPAWEAYDQEERKRLIEGGRRWRVSVKAGASTQLKAQYVVKLYANNELAGGNRREA